MSIPITVDADEEEGRAELARIRQEHPRWGILRIAGRWYAVRGRAFLIDASTADELRSALASFPVGAVRPTPDNVGDGTGPSRPVTGERDPSGERSATIAMTRVWGISPRSPWQTFD